MTGTHPIGAPNHRWSAFVPAVYTPTEFLLSCDAHQVHLQLATAVGEVIGLFQMEPLDTPSRWGLTLNLKPGMYRYRYYADCGRVTTYVYPGEVDDGPTRMDGLDAILTVPVEVQAAAHSSPRKVVHVRSTKGRDSNMCNPTCAYGG